MKQHSHHSAAADRVRALRNLYFHLLVYLVVNLAFWLAELATPASEVWSVWTTVGWGTGVGVHALWTGLSVGEFITKWEERQIMALMRERDGQ